MNTRLIASLAGAFALSLVTAVAAAPPPSSGVASNITAAVSDPARPADQVARDAARKPAEILAFAGIKPGDKVGDFIMGGGYFTRLFSVAVGPAGKVYAYQPAEFIQFQAKYGTDQDTVVAAYKNVVPLKNSLGAVSFPEKLDVVFTAQNYHDLHLDVMPKVVPGLVNKALFDSLKPGGVLIVIDHYAVDGTGTTTTNALHRIDIATVKSEILSAGFVLDDESDMLRDPSDSRTVSVFDASIRGKTDQFVLKFRKPK